MMISTNKFDEYNPNMKDPTEFTVVPNGIYLTEIVDTVDKDNGIVRFQFKITSGDFADQSVFYNCQPNHEKEGLMKFHQNMLAGLIIQSGIKNITNSSQLIGVHVKIEVTKFTDKQGKDWNKVIRLHVDNIPF